MSASHWAVKVVLPSYLDLVARAAELRAVAPADEFIVLALRRGGEAYLFALVHGDGGVINPGRRRAAVQVVADGEEPQLECELPERAGAVAVVKGAGDGVDALAGKDDPVAALPSVLSARPAASDAVNRT